MNKGTLVKRRFVDPEDLVQLESVGITLSEPINGIVEVKYKEGIFKQFIKNLKVIPKTEAKKLV